MFVRQLNVAIRSSERAIAALHRLNPPESDSRAFARLLTDSDVEDLDAHEVRDDVRSRQIPQAKAAARRLDALDKQVHRLSRSLGLNVCAKD